MKYVISEDPPKLDVEIDFSVEPSLKSFKEEVLNSLYETYKKYKVERILLSDGMDSRFLALCLMELGIQFKPLSFKFSEESTDVLQKIEKFSKQYGLKTEYFKIEEDKLFNHINFLTYEKKIAYSVTNGYYHDYLLSNFSESFWSGLQNEFRYYDNEYVTSARVSPCLITYKYFPNRLFGFDTSRVFLSYLNHPKFLSHFRINRNNLPRNDEYYIRDLIYTDVYPNLSINLKGPWGDLPILLKFQEKLNEIKKEVPWVFELEVCKFNVHEYFDNKS